MDLKRGDNKEIYFSVPAEIAPEGATLYFMAKPQPDDDFNDEKAVISLSTTNRVVKGNLAEFTINVQPSDTKNINVGNKSVVNLMGEFEIRTIDGKVYSLPQNNRYIKVKVFADIRRGGE